MYPKKSARLERKPKTLNERFNKKTNLPREKVPHGGG